MTFPLCFIGAVPGRTHFSGPSFLEYIILIVRKLRAGNVGLSRSALCPADVLVVVISQDSVEELDGKCCSENQKLYAAGRRRHFADIPVSRNHGPLLPVIALRPSSHHALGFGHNYH